jgi:glutaconate CoA-transferase, subunit B
MNLTPEDWMVIAAAREIQDGEVLFVGSGLPHLALALAQQTHAPHAVGYFEDGTVQERPGSGYASGSVHLLGLLAQGAVDLGLIIGEQVDRYGNLNTTYIGPYHQPTQRLPGSGSAADVASLAHRFVVMMPHEKHRLVEQVDYVTGPGFGTGGQWRDGAGLPRGGPAAIVTTLAILRFDGEGEIYLANHHPFTSVEEVQANTGWTLHIAEDTAPTPNPSSEALAVLRRLRTQA